MKIRITKGPSVPEDVPTWANLGTLPLQPPKAGWGVRVPIGSKVRSGDSVTVLHLCGKVTDVTLAEKVYENDRFTYWTEDPSLDPDGGEARAASIVDTCDWKNDYETGFYDEGTLGDRGD